SINANSGFCSRDDMLVCVRGSFSAQKETAQPAGSEARAGLAGWRRPTGRFLCDRLGRAPREVYSVRIKRSACGGRRRDRGGGGSRLSLFSNGGRENSGQGMESDGTFG